MPETLATTRVQMLADAAAMDHDEVPGTWERDHDHRCPQLRRHDAECACGYRETMDALAEARDAIQRVRSELSRISKAVADA